MSCFGNDGQGDTGDNWRVICDGQSKGISLTGRIVFQIQHVDTKRYLFTEAGVDYNNRNCGNNCPIMGQVEISCDERFNANNKWRITSVIIFWW